MSERKLPLLARLAGYRVAHATGRLQQLPINLTVSVTYSCPSRCLTCDIWQKKVDDLRLDEYARLFPTLHKVPVWVTVSGGDQFIRSDLDEIIRLIRVQIEPMIINIPMNGVITERIFNLLPKICANSVGSQLVLNLSVDEIGTEHDRLRGADRNYEKLLLVAELIRDLKKTYDHIVLGVHTVISKHNVHRIPEIARQARATFRARLVHHRGGGEPRRAEDDRQRHHPVGGRVPARGLDPEGLHPCEPLEEPRGPSRPVPPARLLRSRGADPRRAPAGHRLLRGLGERAPRARWERLGVLRAGRERRQCPRHRVRLRRGLVRGEGGCLPHEREEQGVRVPAGERELHEHAARAQDARARRGEHGRACGQLARER